MSVGKTWQAGFRPVRCRRNFGTPERDYADMDPTATCKRGRRCWCQIDTNTATGTHARNYVALTKAADMLSDSFDDILEVI